MDKRVRIGAIGAGITAICCFTPILSILLSALGLGAALGVLDLVLLPALAVFLAMIGYGLWKSRGKPQARM